MRLVLYIFLLLVLTLSSSGPTFSIDENSESTSPKGEYLVALVDISSPKVIKAKLFFAVSQKKQSRSTQTFIINDIDRKYISSIEINDYLYFKARFINPLEKKFHDDFLGNLNVDDLHRKLDIINVVFFQQPFWMIHLAFKLPTSLLEWQVWLKEKQSGQDQWIKIMSADDSGLPHEFESNFEYDLELPLSVRYSVPEKKDHYTTRGVMLSYSEIYSTESQLTQIVDRLLKFELQHTPSGQIMYFPLEHVYIMNKDTSGGLILNSKTDTRMDENSLINRINAKEDGFFVSSTGLITTDNFLNSDMVIQKYSHYILSPAETSPYTLSFADSLDESRGFVMESSNPGKMAYYTGLAQILLSGLLVWVIFFWLFFRSVVRRLNILKFVGLSFLTYLLYALVSLVFSFMLGFGFLLGLILMISIMRLHTGDTSTIRLFAFSFMTSLLTAFTMFLLGSFVF